MIKNIEKKYWNELGNKKKNDTIRIRNFENTFYRNAKSIIRKIRTLKIKKGWKNTIQTWMSQGRRVENIEHGTIGTILKKKGRRIENIIEITRIIG